MRHDKQAETADSPVDRGEVGGPTAAEAAFDEAERRYRELLRSAPAAICEVDFQRRRFASVNDATCDMLGYSREELLALDLMDILDDAGRERFEARIAAWLGGHEPDKSVEYVIRAKDGRRLDVVLSARFTRDPQGNPLGATVVAHDVTERRQRERRIARYNRVLRGINQIFEHVIRAESEEALVNTCLAVALEVTDSQLGFVNELGDDGLLHELAMSDTAWEQCRMPDRRGHLRPPAEFAVRGLVGRAVVERRSVLTNDPSTAPDSVGVPSGHPQISCFLGVPLMHDGRAVGILAVANRPGGYGSEQKEDLEALAPAVVEALFRRRAEAALQESRRDLARAQEVGQIGSWRLELPSNVLTWSDEVYRMFGVPLGTPLTYEEFLDAVHLDDRAYVDTAWEAALQGEPYDTEHRIIVGDRVRWVRERAYLEFDDDGTLLSGFGIVQDITDRKQIEAALRNERQLLQTIYDTIPVMLTIYDPRIEEIVLNKHVERVTGWTQADTTETHLMELVYPDPEYREEVAAYMQSLQPGFRDIRMATKDGGTVETSWANVALPDGRQVGIGIDISERKRAEEALRRLTNRLRILHEIDELILAAQSAAEVAQSAVAQVPRLVPCLRASVTLYDPERHEVSLLALYAERETGVGEGWHGATSDAYERVLRQLRSGREGVVFDVEGLDDASPTMAQLIEEGVRSVVHAPLVIEGQLAGTLNLGLTEPGPLSDEQWEMVHELAVELSIGLEQARLHEEVRHSAEELERLVHVRTEALEASEARFRTIFEEAAIGLALVGRDGALVATNPALETMLGYSAEELAGKAVLDLLFDGEESVAMAGELFAGQRHQCALEAEYLRRNGEPGSANVRLSALGEEADAPSLILALIEDITERKRAQEALIEAERLTAIGRMAASLAHEINNPLQSVVGCLGLAIERLETGDEAGRLMDVAMDEVRRAARIVHRMRDLGRPDAGKKQPARVDMLIDKVLVLVQNQARNQNVEIVWEPAEEPILVRLVEDRIRQVFLNLVLNAIDAMPNGGTLRIEVSRTKAPSGVQVAFVDSGIGIPEDGVGRLFEAFRSTKERGMGLGLFVSRNIVQEHKGWIDVQSEVGRGTTFTVWLPDD